MKNSAGVPAFILANTAIVSPPLVPELRLHLATEITPIWHATEAELETIGLPPPYWAFCWPGGQALARYVLDNPALVAGRSVLDFACGGAVSGLAGVMAGAAGVLANDIDGFALAAAGMNADLNGLTMTACGDDLVASDGGRVFDVILAGDIFYERPASVDIRKFLFAQAARGATVLIGDPGRKYLPDSGLEEMAHYAIPTSLEIESSENLNGVVWQVLPA